MLLAAHAAHAHARRLSLQSLGASVRVLHSAEQKEAKDGHEGAGNDLDDEGVDPEVDPGDGLPVGAVLVYADEVVVSPVARGPLLDACDGDGQVVRH